MVKPPTTSVPDIVPPAALSETIHLQAFSEDEETLFEELRLCLAVARARFGSVRDVKFELVLQGHVPQSSISISLGSGNQRSKHYRRAIDNTSS